MDEVTVGAEEVESTSSSRWLGRCASSLGPIFLFPMPHVVLLLSPQQPTLDVKKKSERLFAARSYLL